jgi:hypothetical protein
LWIHKNLNFFIIIIFASTIHKKNVPKGKNLFPFLKISFEKKERRKKIERDEKKAWSRDTKMFSSRTSHTISKRQPITPKTGMEWLTTTFFLFFLFRVWILLIKNLIE